MEKIGSPSEFASNDGVIWRYLTYKKFEYLVNTASLYIPRADRFTDQFEGYCPNVRVEGAKEDTATLSYMIRRLSFVSCWHRSDWESEAMWGLYLPQREKNADSCRTDEGVAVCVKVSSLVRQYTAFESALSAKVDGEISTSPLTANCGYVRYSSPHLSAVETKIISLSELLFYKRAAYEHEKEFRLTIELGQPELARTVIHLPLKLDELVFQIVLQPKASESFAAQIRELAKKVGIHDRVRRSSLDDEPNWQSIQPTGDAEMNEWIKTKFEFRDLFPKLPPGTP